MQNYENEVEDLYYQDTQLLEDSSTTKSQQYIILSSKEILKQMEEEIASIQEMIPFNFDNTLELFIHYNWNKDNIENNYFLGDEDKIIEQLKLKGEFNDHKISILPKGHCSVCLEEQQELVQLGCDHAFCRNCLIGSVRQRVDKDKYHYVRCLQDLCPYRLPYSFIITCTQEYQTILCQQYIEKSKILACCTGSNCNRIIRPLNNQEKEIECECGHVFCFRCREDAHNPAPCDLAQKWFRLIRNGEENLKWIANNTKPCPFCHIPIEKIGSGSQMKCMQPVGCGECFCFFCNDPWEPDHFDEFQCPKQKEMRNEGLQLETIKNFQHYYHGYINSEKQKQWAQERQAELPSYRQQCQQIYDIYGFSFQDSQFLSEALGELIQSRVVLKWSYCLGYYINSNDKIASQLFDDYQDLFEHSCELLAINLVNPFEEIALISRKNDNDVLYYYEILRSNFIIIKQNVKNASMQCAKYRRNLQSSYNENIM